MIRNFSGDKILPYTLKELYDKIMTGKLSK